MNDSHHQGNQRNANGNELGSGYQNWPGIVRFAGANAVSYRIRDSRDPDGVISCSAESLELGAAA